MAKLQSVGLTLSKTSSLFFQSPWTPPGPIGVLGAVAARHAEEG